MLDRIIASLLMSPKFRLFGAVLSGLEVVNTNAITTMAVAVKNNKIQLLYNQDFAVQMGTLKLAFVLMHEAAHVLLSTLLRGQGKDRELFNLASDAIINSLLIEDFRMREDSVPEDAVTLLMLAKQGAIRGADTNSMTAEEIYNELSRNVRSVNRSGCRLDIDGSQTGFCVWSYDEVFDISRSAELPGIILEEIGKVLNEYSGAGTEAGNFIARVKHFFPVKFPFEQVLKKIFDKQRYDFSRENRRIKVTGSYIPRRRSPAFKIYCAVDVSGSCAGYTENFLGYIMALPEFEEVAFFDTRITSIVRKGQQIPAAIPGYGGTDLNPVLDWFKAKEKENGSNTNFIVLSDGYVGSPDKNRFPLSEVIVFTCGQEVPACHNIMIKV